MDSILQDEKKCFICGRKTGLHSHHVMFGNPNRKLSELYGLKVYLCQPHHTGDKGVHKDIRLDWQLKRIAQEQFERRYDRNKWMEVFGRNYLED